MKVWLVVSLGDQERKYRLNGENVVGTFDDFSDDWSEEVPLYFFNFTKKEYEKVFFYTEVEKEFADKGVKKDSEG